MNMELPRLPRASPPGPAPIEHGGLDLEELGRLGVDPAKLLDFSVCTNPYGPPPGVRSALTEVAIERYPDRDTRALRAALAEKYGLAPPCILAGNGVSELIWLTALAFLRPAHPVLVIGPTYGEYARSAYLCGAAVTTWKASADKQFAVDEGALVSAIERLKPRLVFLCNPNNPTGSCLPPKVIGAWARSYRQTLFVVDEAYQAFAPGLESLISTGAPNLLILRSMTKDYALAGLRVGYAVGSEEVIAALGNVRPPWSVNAFAQAAAVAALRDEGFLRRTLGALEQAKRAFVTGLGELGLPAWPSATHFVLVRVGDSSAFRRKLLERAILVRDATSFGLPAFVRLATRTPEENARLLAVLREVTW